MRLLILFGPPSVGKMTVGTLIEEQTKFTLFHNHQIMDGVMHIFGRGSPAEDRLSRLIRTAVIEEAAESDIDLIFTYVWNFKRDKGKHNIDAYKQLYESRGGSVYFVELVAPVEERIKRATNPERYKIKAHAPTPEEVADLQEAQNFQSPSPFFYPDIYKQVDTTNKTADAVALEIINWLQSQP